MESYVSGWGAMVLLIECQLLYFAKNLHYNVLRYAGLVTMFSINVYMTEIVVKNGTYKIYEGYLTMIALEFYISTNLVLDIWLFPIVTFLGHSYCIINFHLYLSNIPPILIPCLYVPVVVQAFKSYTFNMQTKKEFILFYSQNTTIERFYKLFESIPERIVITQNNNQKETKFLFTNDEFLDQMEKNKRCEFHEDAMKL
jgi:hypothetical protein